MSDALPVLWSFRRCPYAMRARMAIHAAGVECELREIVLRDKPAAMLTASPKGTVPVLVLPGGRVIDESLDVMDWALARSDPQGWRDAANPSIRERIKQADEIFKHHLDRYKYANRYDGAIAGEHRAAGAAILQDWNTLIAENGFIAGQAETQADIAIFPFVRQFANTDREWFDAQDWPALHTWLSRYLTSARFADVMTKFPLWQANDAPLVFPANA